MAVLFAHPEALIVDNGPGHVLFVEGGADTRGEEHFGVPVSEVPDNHSIGGEEEHSVFLLSGSGEELVLSDLHDVAIAQMLDYEPVGQGRGDLVVRDLVELLIIEKVVKLVQLFRL